MSIAQRLAAVGTGVATIAATVVGMAAPAQAAYPTTPYNVVFGNTLTEGAITWYARGVQLSGTTRTTAGNCRRLYAYAYTTSNDLISDEHSLVAVCQQPNYPSISESDGVYLPANLAGGAYLVKVCLEGQAYDEKLWHELKCEYHFNPSF